MDDHFSPPKSVRIAALARVEQNQRDDLLIAWNALWDQADQVFDRESFVNSVITAMASPHPECKRPSREDMASAVAELCQAIKTMIAVAEAITQAMTEKDVQ